MTNVLGRSVFSVSRVATRISSQARWLSTGLASLQQNVRVVVSDDRKSLKLFCEGEQERRFHGLWLRHNCRCSSCTAIHHNWKSIVDGKNIKVKSASVEGDQVNVEWCVSGSAVHTGYFPLNWLKENDYSNPETDRNNKPLVAVSSHHVNRSHVEVVVYLCRTLCLCLAMMM